MGAEEQREIKKSELYIKLSNLRGLSDQVHMTTEYYLELRGRVGAGDTNLRIKIQIEKLHRYKYIDRKSHKTSYFRLSV